MIKQLVVVSISLGILFSGRFCPVYSRDYIGEFVLENYNETQAQFSYDPLIYQSIQVNTSAGPKVLILEGDDYNYRKWLRQYIASNKQLIIRIDDDRNDEFISSKAFKMDIRSIHPVNSKKWSDEQIKGAQRDVVSGTNHILIVDVHPKRGLLIKAVVEKMGFQARVFKRWEQAINTFRLQPEKFKMIIAHHESIGTQNNNFIDQVLKIDPEIPVMIDTGYQNSQLKKEISTRFSDKPSIFVKPVALRELSNTIKKLILSDV